MPSAGCHELQYWLKMRHVRLVTVTHEMVSGKVRAALVNVHRIMWSDHSMGPVHQRYLQQKNGVVWVHFHNSPGLQATVIYEESLCVI